MNEDLFLFPTFTQNYVWTRAAEEGSPTNEELTFQTKEGMSVTADVGISYFIREKEVANVFKKYRKGVEEITDIFLRNEVRDAMVKAASKRPIESVYGEGKAEFMNEVYITVKNSVDSIGIQVEKIYLIGDLRLPENVIAALNAKIAATQLAQQKENEVQASKAEALKSVAAAEGKAKSIEIEAKAQAEANRILAASITPTLVEYKRIEKWDGKLPYYTGGPTPMLNVK